MLRFPFFTIRLVPQVPHCGLLFFVSWRFNTPCAHLCLKHFIVNCQTESCQAINNFYLRRCKINLIRSKQIHEVR